MSTRQLQLILVLCALGPLISLTAFHYSEIKAQEARMEDGYHVFPVPIPAHLDFCGEAVPLDAFGIKERLDRELLVNSYWGSQTLLILKRSASYFAVIDPILSSYDIPSDLRYLAVAESALQPARSSAGAQGIWQWMPNSAREMGLQVDDEIDERLNLEKSTDAACRYLREAKERFGSWTLAAAAYNRGMNGLARAMEDQQVHSYYDLHLNTETSRYLLRILAFKSILEHPRIYGFELDEKDKYSFPQTKTTRISAGIPDLGAFAREMGSSYHVIKSLNPWILGNSLPASEEGYQLKTPL